MGDDAFFPYTSSVGKSFLRLGSDGSDDQMVRADDVSSMGDTFPNMRQLGFKLGVC